jgi:hypothetical protein
MMKTDQSLVLCVVVGWDHHCEVTLANSQKEKTIHVTSIPSPQALVGPRRAGASSSPEFAGGTPETYAPRSGAQEVEAKATSRSGGGGGESGRAAPAAEGCRKEAESDSQ